ncbi:hypothetical protein VOLCADRAFT_96665 [Volvox carteri f. nagariensis]|uniref:Peptidase M43 pregnancy-associated plasma-A domain-containing protein n=1 Tax=Volvox carteri f. nagariensis TaxID=3068 RepID=D8UAQ6_VOLCA|nr:uncharacterized protein VOLCADRAFT_96665 [Volvox carteri f. nagariensis]EFJ43197.1 hypothetical protein VOLCADRAFT_96665 [Volvox carteri f. nagariensis]|eukprot:XP_002955772.1 hypothetical protein VOLCADRAFT_96665 [Volvox carteri f. nagariensis]
MPKLQKEFTIRCPRCLLLLSSLMLAGVLLHSGGHAALATASRLYDGEGEQAAGLERLAAIRKQQQPLQLSPPAAGKPPSRPPPFLAVRNTESASSDEAQRLYGQASSVSYIAYLLFGAAEPMSEAEGSSSILLPYLTPTVLRVYASQPGLCSSAVVEQMYGLSACHYGLLKALRTTFSWVRNNIPLLLQEVPGQPQATAAWPDLSALSEADFTAAVRDALLLRGSGGDQLAEAAATVSGPCGLSITDFAALHDAASRLHIFASRDAKLVQPPSAIPKLLIPLVFHVMLYMDGNTTGPAKYELSAFYVQRLVQITNYMSRPTNIEFFVKEVRNNATAYPYLLLKDRKTWLQVPNLDCVPVKVDCFLSTDFVPRTASDFPRSINVYVANDLTLRIGVMGYAFVPGSDTLASQGFVFISWDQLAAEGANSLALYNDGSNTLLHELFHHMGLQHPFYRQPSLNLSSCDDGDAVVDTPSAKGKCKYTTTTREVPVLLRCADS